MFNLLLTKTLIPSKTRVVAVGSLVHNNGKVVQRSHDMTGVSASFSATQFYANSKLFNTLWSFQVNQRYSAQGVTSNSVHPGSGLFTNLGREDASTLLKCCILPFLYCFAPLFWLFGFFQTWHDGGVANVAAAEYAEGGHYFYRHRVSRASATARDVALQEWVFDETNRILKEIAAKYNLPAEIAGPPQS